MGLLDRNKFVLPSAGLEKKLGNIAIWVAQDPRNVRRVMVCDTIPPLPKIAMSDCENQWQVMVGGGDFPLPPPANVVAL